jgi:hypothetical protein
LSQMMGHQSSQMGVMVYASYLWYAARIWRFLARGV